VVHRRDSGVGAVALSIGGEPEHEEAAQQGTETDHQREGPWAREGGRRRMTAFADGRRDVVAGNGPEEEVGSAE
jgi:hypothetical protein